MCGGKMKSATSYLAVGLLTCVLAQTIQGFWLRKTGRREGGIGARFTGVQEGKIVFGRVFQKRTGRESPSNSSVDDESAYQADSPVVNGQGQSTSPSDVAWKRMATSLQCGGEQMRLKVVGAGAANFAVDQGNAGPPMALSQVPSTCGYTMQRNPFALLMLVPYDGCNMVQEGGSYKLPMLWKGIPVSLWCPSPAEPSAEPSPEPQQPITIPQVTVTPIPPKQEPLNPQSQISYLLYPYNLGALPDPTPAPTTKPVTQKVQQYSLFYPQNYYFPNPLQTTAVPTTAAPTTQPPAEPQTLPKFPPQYPPQYPLHFPVQYPPQFPPQLPKLPTFPTLPPHLPKLPPQLPTFPTLPPQHPKLPPQVPTFPTLPPQLPKLPPQVPTFPTLPPQLPKLPPQLPTFPTLPPQHPELPPQLPTFPTLPPHLLKLPPQFPYQLPPQFPYQLPPQFPYQLPPQFPLHLLQFPPQIPQKDFIPYPTTPVITTTVTPATKKSEPIQGPVLYYHSPEFQYNPFNYGYAS